MLAHKLDLNLLELFDVVHRTQNLTAAGLQMGLSQPAVSAGLARLRSSYGDPLFIRTQRGVRATPFADQIIEQIRAALQIVGATINGATFSPIASRASFRIAMTDIGERTFLPSLTHRLAIAAPSVTIATLSLPIDELSRGLATGSIDAVVGYVPDLTKEIRRNILFREQFVYILGRDILARESELTLAHVREFRHVIASPPGTMHAASLEKVLSSRNVRASIALRVQSFLSIAPIVAATNLIAPVPSNLAKAVAGHLDLRVCHAPFSLPAFDVSLYWHQRAHSEPANMWLRQELTDAFRDARHLINQ